MLSQASYEALLPYRSAPVPVGANGLSEREKELLDDGYIAPCEMSTKAIHGAVHVLSVFAKSYAITPNGEDALAEFEEARNAQRKAKTDKKAERRFQILLALFSAALGAAATLLIEHSDVILNVFSAIFK